MKTIWDQRFAAEHYVYGKEPNAFVAAMAATIPPGPVLCLAEGEGRNAVHLAELGHAVTAVDQSAVGLAKAACLAANRGVPLTTVAADLACYTIAAGAWAGIVSTFAHLPRTLRREVHAQVVAGLRPGGVFILEAYTPAQLALGTGGPKDAALCLTLAGLRDELAGLEFLIGRECEREVIEGTGHTGRGAVVQVVARRPTPPDTAASPGPSVRPTSGARPVTPPRPVAAPAAGRTASGRGSPAGGGSTTPTGAVRR